MIITEANIESKHLYSETETWDKIAFNSYLQSGCLKSNFLPTSCYHVRFQQCAFEVDMVVDQGFVSGR